ncbi:transposase [Cereibacter sphaeroides]|uniref:transposase n=1 Tax=Cereibacter sphaeroides TaxID=1063 RepID=UPI003AF10327|nr:transposase [Cereibacter sphaeroides]
MVLKAEFLACTGDIQRFATANALASAAGLAPVQRVGQTRWMATGFWRAQGAQALRPALKPPPGQRAAGLQLVDLRVEQFIGYGDLTHLRLSRCAILSSRSFSALSAASSACPDGLGPDAASVWGTRRRGRGLRSATFQLVLFVHAPPPFPGNAALGDVSRNRSSAPPLKIRPCLSVPFPPNHLHRNA